jgi:hypothetical protein
MRALWNALETLDRAVFAVLDRRDRWQGRETLLVQTQKATADVKPPQRLITFES